MHDPHVKIRPGLGIIFRTGIVKGQELARMTTELDVKINAFLCVIFNVYF